MKKLKSKNPLNLRRNVLVSLLSILLVGLTIYGCTKHEIGTKPLEVVKPQSFEKQIVVYDKTGNNSVVVRISSNEEAQLSDYIAKNYELLINPEVRKASPVENVLEDDSETNSLEDIKLVSAIVQIDVVELNFKDKVSNYALVSTSPVKIITENEEQGEKGSIFCRWFPRPSDGFQYYNVKSWGAKSVKVDFNRTKTTCNNIQYFVCDYNSSNPVASCELKSPGDTRTFGPYNSFSGINLMWRQYQNQIATYTFYY